MLNPMRSRNSEKARRPIPAVAAIRLDSFDMGDGSANHPASATQNDLLAALPASDLDFLAPHLEYVELSFGKELHTQGSKLSHVYFPTTAIIATIYLLSDGAMTEIGVTGHEGFIGISILLAENELGTAKVQSAGHAYRLKASVLKQACLRCGKLQYFLMRYTHALFAQMAQNSVCSHHYSFDQQFSRWLLDRLDRLPANVLKATQEMIANMLGVRRETVTEAAGRLQQAGLIRNYRGMITVLDRDGLELLAGECYQVVRHEFDRVLAGSAPPARIAEQALAA